MPPVVALKMSTSHQALTSFIILRDEVPRLMTTAHSGDPGPRAIVQIITKWLALAAGAARHEAPLCISCDTGFHGGAEAAGFALLLPFIPTEGQAAIAGICADCVEQSGEDLPGLAAEHWRKLFPGIQKLPEGRG